MTFFPDGVIEHGRKSVLRSNPLVSVVRDLPPNAKKAMYAAAEKGLIKRRTWNGCAWNKAAEMVGHKNVKDSTLAASVFGCSSAKVSNFISVWDNLPGTDARCTALLKDAIDQSGISTEENMNKAVKVLRGFAYKSLDTQFKEQLADVDNITDIPGMTGEMVEHALAMLDTCSA